MNLLVLVVLLLGIFLAAQWITGRFARPDFALTVLDVPGARSSHAVATPRGGGMAIVLTTVGALVILGALGVMKWQEVWGLVGGGIVVALVGFADDHKNIAPQWRLLGHFVAATWVVAWLGGVPAVRMFGSDLSLGVVGDIFATIYLVWLVNLTNFMDGIDGIAGVEAITVSIGGTLLYVTTVPGTTYWLVPLVLATATFGFLVWNWPPAKIFMGDGGSGFLGLVLAALSLQAAWIAPTLLWSWLIMMGVFIVDATVTLIQRVVRGERFYEAHRSHAYQHAAQRVGSHLPVVLGVGTINLGWLLPIALLVARGAIDGFMGLVIAYIPLMVAALWLKAGQRGAV